MKNLITNVAWQFTLSVLLLGCSHQYRSSVQGRNMQVESTGMIVIKNSITFDEDRVINNEVTIYPEARIYTTNNAKVHFRNKVNVLGQTQVFDTKADVSFGKYSLGTINPCWFGATGSDESDDTDAFEKVLGIAGGFYNSVNIFIPIGRYNISRTLNIESTTATQKSIHIHGESMSISGNHGTSLTWIGKASTSMLRVNNNFFCSIENVDLAVEYTQDLQYNIELRPIVYQMTFKNCSFSGVAGLGSANVNINSGNNLQVSEIYFENCVFRGKVGDNNEFLTESAVIGGLANTKNFYFRSCSFGRYTKAAINIEVSDILSVQNCTFTHNEVDLICLLCNTVALSNYSERSGAFFKSTYSSNTAFTSLIGNYFEGNPEDDYVVRDGAGSLTLINNNFGSSGGDDQVNKIQWDTSRVSSIYSLGNFFKNENSETFPFVNRFDGQAHPSAQSIGDKVGENGQVAKRSNVNILRND